MLILISLSTLITVSCLAFYAGRGRVVTNPEDRLVRYQARSLNDLQHEVE